MTAQSATAMRPAKGSVPIRQNSGSVYEQFDRVYDSIARRAFELFQANSRLQECDLDNWLRAEAEFLHPVQLDLTESDADFTVQAEVPGFSTNDLEIMAEPRRLCIAGKRDIKNGKIGRKICSEWPADQIYRAVELPADVDVAKVNASLKDGILTIEMPKAPHAKTMRIEPKSA
jgi:HSP20 family protein